VIDTGYGPRVPEIRSAIAWALHQSPRWLIDTHGHFDHTDGNSTFAEDQTTVGGHANCRARMSQHQFVPSLEWRVRSSPRSAWPGLTFNAAVRIDHAINCKQTNPVEAIRDITGGGVDYYLAFFRARRGQSEALGAALGALVEPTRLEAGCLNYDLHRSVNDANVWFVYENWR
jgi:hypothetical protein